MHATMKAICVRGFGGVDTMILEEVPRPRPGAGEVLVRVHAAGVNVLDWLVRQGGFEEFGHIQPPWIPGWDLSGVVAEIGPQVSGFDIGQDVFGMVRLPQPGNAYAEYASVPAGHIVAKPATVDHAQAAAVPMAALTAWRALFDEGRLQPGQRVLVHAGAGGVGHLAVQLAKGHGAHVVATASAANATYLQILGVDQVIDYRTQRFEDAAEPVDLVVDTLGGAVQKRSLNVLNDGGTLVALAAGVAADVQTAAAARGLRTRYFSVVPNPDALTRIAERLGAGTLTPTIQSIRPLAAALAAHAEGQAGHVRGKLVLDPRMPVR